MTTLTKWWGLLDILKKREKIKLAFSDRLWYCGLEYGVKQTDIGVQESRQETTAIGYAQNDKDLSQGDGEGSGKFGQEIWKKKCQDLY